MARKKKVKSKNKIVTSGPIATNNKAAPSSVPFPRRNMAVVLTLFALALYIQTIRYDYTYDDKTLIGLNTYTQMGFEGIPTLLKSPRLYGFEHRNDGRYSPLATTTHAVMFEFFGANPRVEHIANVILYGSCVLLLYLTLQLLLKNYNPWLSLIAAFFFAGHPIHTEVVASIKSRDELLAFLACFAALFFSLKFVDEKQARYSQLSGLAFLLALLAKESAITFLAVIPLSLYFFRALDAKAAFKTILPHFCWAAVFLVLRYLVLSSYGQVELAGKLENPLIFAPDYSQRLGTAFYILVRYYIGLLFFPHPLVCDYSFNQIPLVSLSSTAAFVSLLFCLALGYWALSTLRLRRVSTFAALFFLITISVVSNIIIPIGTIMGERLLFVPSVGFCLLLAYALARQFKFSNHYDGAPPRAAYLICGLILCIYTAKTLDRNRDWKNEESLYEAEITKSPRSAKLNQSMGNLRLEQARFDDAAVYFQSALDIFPEDPNTLAWLAIVETRRGNKDKAIEIYKRALKINSNYRLAYYKIGILFLERGEFENAIKAFDACLKLNPEDKAAASLLEKAKEKAKSVTASPS